MNEGYLDISPDWDVISDEYEPLTRGHGDGITDGWTDW